MMIEKIYTLLTHAEVVPKSLGFSDISKRKIILTIKFLFRTYIMIFSRFDMMFDKIK